MIGPAAISKTDRDCVLSILIPTTKNED